LEERRIARGCLLPLPIVDALIEPRPNSLSGFRLRSGNRRPVTPSDPLINTVALLRYGQCFASPDDNYFTAGDINVG